MGFYEDVANTAEFLRGKTAHRPETCIILGSGLDALMDKVRDADHIPYAEIPGFPVSGVAGHAARMIFGTLGGREVALMCGRFHFYEGHSMKQVAFPLFVLHEMGAQTLIVTNACGGINESFTPGDLMLITDHINLTGNNPLTGPNDERFGPRFPDMTEVYSRDLRRAAKEQAEALEIPMKEGVYALFPGPMYETAAEIRAFRTLGADAIGMSTVPEVTAARYLGMKVLGISCITNMATGIAKKAHSHEAVLEKARQSGERLCALIEAVTGSIQHG